MTSRCWNVRRPMGPTAPRARAKCAPIRCCPRWPTPSTTPSACASTISRSRRRRCCAASRRKAARGRKGQALSGAAPKHRRHRLARGAGAGAARRLLSRRRGRRDGGLSRARARQAAVAGGRAGRRQDRMRQGDCGGAGASVDPAAMLRGHRRLRRALRMELSTADAGDPAGGRSIDRYLRRGVPDRAADAGGFACAGFDGAAD